MYLIWLVQGIGSVFLLGDIYQRNSANMGSMALFIAKGEPNGLSSDKSMNLYSTPHQRAGYQFIKLFTHNSVVHS